MGEMGDHCEAPERPDDTPLQYLRGFAFEGALGLAFVALKLFEAIDWPWPLVIAPFFVPFVFLILVALLCGVVDDEREDS